MTIKLDKRIETAFKKGFYSKRRNKIEFINPKRKRITIDISSDGFDIDEFKVHSGAGCSFYSLDRYGEDWALTEDELHA
jgi:hypothetical protein